MQVILSKPVIGYRREFEDTVQDWSRPRTHADVGDILKVVKINKTNFTCKSKYYPDETVIVFPKQCSEVPDNEEITELEEELNDSYNELTETQLTNDIFDPDELEY